MSCCSIRNPRVHTTYEYILTYMHHLFTTLLFRLHRRQKNHKPITCCTAWRRTVAAAAAPLHNMVEYWNACAVCANLLLHVLCERCVRLVFTFYAEFWFHCSQSHNGKDGMKYKKYDLESCDFQHSTHHIFSTATQAVELQSVENRHSPI